MQWNMAILSKEAVLYYPVIYKRGLVVSINIFLIPMQVCIPETKMYKYHDGCSPTGKNSGLR